jgi:hypothetical protein
MTNTEYILYKYTSRESVQTLGGNFSHFLYVYLTRGPVL